MSDRPASQSRLRIWTIEGEQYRSRSDRVVTEEPLEIRLIAGTQTQTVAITMRTPGADFELAAGFLYSEGIIEDRKEIQRITYCVDTEVDVEQRYNIVNVALSLTDLPNLVSLERHFFTNSACGVCGKASIDSLRLRSLPPIPRGLTISAKTLYSLPEQIRTTQSLFATTGGLHAAALFNTNGQLVALREDVGRHNALDKLIGWALLQNKLPLHQHIVLVSGRTSFELLQKCVVAGVPILCAISAPSNLAVILAREFGITLIGFLRDERCNIYSAPERVEVAI